MIRKIVFWMHLTSGVLAAAVIIIMSVTGVLLTYEHQMIESADMKLYRATVGGEARIPLQQAINAVVEETGGIPTAISIRSANDAPYEVVSGRRGRAYVDAYTGEYLGAGDNDIRVFFSVMTNWHRRLGMEGDSRATGRMLTGVSNLLFLFLVLSGMYLWLPRIWKWVILKNQMWFNPRVDNAKARDYNWHHVFGIWSAIPLVIVVATAVVFSYSWANNLVFMAVGEDPPQRGGGRGGGGSGPVVSIQVSPGVAALSMDDLLAEVQSTADGWQLITVGLTSGPSTPVPMGVNFASGRQPQREETWYVDPYTGQVAAKTVWGDRSLGARARTAVRFLHTGEYLGVAGQTIAGLVSLFSLIMAWTGIALAWRRLISPLLRKKSA